MGAGSVPVVLPPPMGEGPDVRRPHPASEAVCAAATTIVVFEDPKQRNKTLLRM